MSKFSLDSLPDCGLRPTCLRTWPWIAVFIIYALVLVLNPGFMGTDEYWTGITRYIPAQTSQLQTLVGLDDVKSPTQIWPLYAAAQVALKIGILNPYEQYRFVVILVGLLNILLLAGSLFLWSRQVSPRESLAIKLLLSFYFAAPFAFTRPMFESLAAPWLSWAGLFAFLYDQNPKLRILCLGILSVSIGFLLRPQVGLCALVFLALPLIHRRYQHLLWAGLLGIALLLLTGLPDYFLRGSWHQSLQALTFYNFDHGHEYGSQPWTFYPLLLLGLIMAPLSLHRVRREWLSDYLKRYRVLLLMIFLFVFLHSLFAQKFERFLIPMLPLVLVLMAPWLVSLYEYQHWKRLSAIISINFLLWGAATFQPAQNNIIEMALYLDHHPEITYVYRLNRIPEWIPDAFIQSRKYDFRDIEEPQAKALIPHCYERLILSEVASAELPAWISPQRWIPEVHFRVNWVEALAYRFNPKNNVRRTQLTLWRPSNCQE